MDIINRFYPPGVVKPSFVSHCPSLTIRSDYRRARQTICSLIVLLLLMSSGLSPADETNQPLPATITSPDTNYLEILRTLTGLADQIRSNQVAIEQNGKDAKEAASRSSELLSKGFRNVQETFSSQQQALSERNTRELEAMQSSNRAVIMAGAIFAAVVAVTLFLIVYFQWRISKAWADISEVIPASRRLNLSSAAALGRGASEPGPAGLADATNTRLLHAVEQLETRVQGLEHNAGSTSAADGSHFSAPGNGDSTSARKHVSVTATAEIPAGSAQARVSAWLEQGQSMLKQNDWQAALQCFDEVLALDPNHGEALVKKGAALERMKKLSEAFECYDRAIAVDESMTIAYLHKGGLCSRLERFKEALECYEKALRTHTDWGS